VIHVNLSAPMDRTKVSGKVPATVSTKPAEPTVGSGERKVRPGDAEDRREPLPSRAPDAGSPKKVSAGGAQLSSSPLAGPGLLEHTEDRAARVEALIASGDDAYRLLDAAGGCEDSKDWADAIQVLRDAGIERGMHTDGAWDPALGGDAAKAQHPSSNIKKKTLGLADTRSGAKPPKPQLV